nr:hypothetical protein [uncultured Cupriavidus sp.]
MESVSTLLAGQPEIAPFLALAVGHALGAFPAGPFRRGGICGTPIAARMIGQTGVRLDHHFRNVTFAPQATSSGIAAARSSVTSPRSARTVPSRSPTIRTDFLLPGIGVPPGPLAMAPM